MMMVVWLDPRLVDLMVVWLIVEMKLVVEKVDKSVVMLDLQDTNCLCMNKHLEYYSIDQSIERLIHLDIPDAYIHLKDNS